MIFNTVLLPPASTSCRPRNSSTQTFQTCRGMSSRDIELGPRRPHTHHAPAAALAALSHDFSLHETLPPTLCPYLARPYLPPDGLQGWARYVCMCVCVCACPARSLTRDTRPAPLPLVIPYQPNALDPLLASWAQHFPAFTTHLPLPPSRVPHFFFSYPCSPSPRTWSAACLPGPHSRRR